MWEWTVDLASTGIADSFVDRRMDLASTGFAGSFEGRFGSVLDCCSCRDRKRAGVLCDFFFLVVVNFGCLVNLK